jgi:hypothetical protein
MPRLTEKLVEAEVRKILSEIPPDESENVDTKKRMELVYARAYEEGWKDFQRLSLPQGMQAIIDPNKP